MIKTEARGEHDVSEVITINKAAQRLRRDPRTVQGVAIGMGIDLVRVATGLCMSRSDFDRLEARLNESRAMETPVGG